MFFSRRRLLGLDIGASTIKAVELSGNEPTLEAYGIVARTSAGVGSDVAGLLSSFGLRSKPVASAVSGRSVIVRYIRLDEHQLVSRSTLQDAVRVEADRYIPFELDEVVLDCQRLEFADGMDYPVNALLVAAKRSLIDERMSMLSGAGLEPRVVEVDAFSLANAYELRERGRLADPQLATAVIDVGASKTNIQIRLSGCTVFTREVYLGGADFDEAIARALELPEAEAERLKLAPFDELPRVQQAIAPVLVDLANEVRLSLEYFEGQFARQTDALLVSGGAARIEGFEQLLGEQLGRSLVRWDPTEALRLGKSVNRDALREDAGQLAVAIGLAGRVLDPAS